MRYIQTFGVLILTVIVVVSMNLRLGKIPPLGKFFDPHHGFWKNADVLGQQMDIDLNGLPVQPGSKVAIDGRGVPHIFAANDHDLYFLQGYLTAKYRLWQMEFQTHAAAGRISEIVGEKALHFDLEQRRMGMVESAQAALDAFASDTVYRNVVQSYTDGVNAHISSIERDDLPFEYRLLDYEPEPWTPLKSSLLLKYMAKMLTGTERDRENTALMALLGEDLFRELYPEQNLLSDPVIPGPYHLSKTDSDSSERTISEGPVPVNTDRPPKNLGSNNWAVSGARTESGLPILCNDPHLRLSLPSIWFEVQLQAPGINCYGVSLPGAPGITIGFNKDVAWGVTNAGRDVKDYYRVEWKDASKKEYRSGDAWKPATFRIDTLQVRNSEPVFDTVRMTEFGPVAYYEDGEGFAFWWTAHQPSNELRTFYLLNRAKNVEDYQEALKTYACPGQNFVFADNSNTIALSQQGNFPDRQIEHGRFIMEAASAPPIPDRIPQPDNPITINPVRGFVSSANQAVADITYPYYYTGVFEEFRNRTINRTLEADSSVSVQDMMDLQNNSYNLLAAEALPVMMELLDTNRFVNKEDERLAYGQLLDWTDYVNERGHIGPTVFQIWWDELNNLIYDELNSPFYDQAKYFEYSWQEMSETGKAYLDMRDPKYVYPMAMVTIDLLKNHPEHRIFDHKFSDGKIDVAADLVYDAFYWTSIKFNEILEFELNEPHWGLYQDTRLQHLARVEALGSPNLFVGGNENAPNAMTATHGPSWRMIVELDEQWPRAYGVYPGGQNGNPGSPGYFGSLDKWMEAKYDTLLFMKDFNDGGMDLQRFVKE